MKIYILTAIQQDNLRNTNLITANTLLISTNCDKIMKRAREESDNYIKYLSEVTEHKNEEINTYRTQSFTSDQPSAMNYRIKTKTVTYDIVISQAIIEPKEKEEFKSGDYAALKEAAREHLKESNPSLYNIPSNLEVLKILETTKDKAKIMYCGLKQNTHSDTNGMGIKTTIPLTWIRKINL